MAIFAVTITSCGSNSSKKTQNGKSASVELLNVSYDPTRELYDEVNKAFVKEWKSKNNQDIKINQSHGGSGKQARAVIDGQPADVVTLALESDIDAIQDAGLISTDWRKRLPNNSVPYTSTIVMVVRKGNPKNIKDFSDLIRPDVHAITPNPKTSGGARWTYLALYGYALKLPGGNDTTAQDFVGKVYKNVPVLDSGARGSTTTFTQRNIGDVLLAWENEALLITHSMGAGGYQIVYPSLSIEADPPVSIVDKVVDSKKTRDLATAYLEFLYTPKGQDIAARNYYRPLSKDIVEKYISLFPAIKTFKVDDTFGGWRNAQRTHFGDNGTFDKIYKKHGQ